MPIVSNNNSNKILAEDHPVHGWYRFVLSFPPHLVREYLDRFSITPKHLVLDPFCGTGTTLVECKKHGIASIGIEAHPMCQYASRVKTDWSLNADQLLKVSCTAYQKAWEQLERLGICDLPDFFDSNKEHELKSLEPEQVRLLLKNSISPLPLHKALVLLEIIDQTASQFTDHQKLAFAKAVVQSASNLHFGPEVGVRTVKDDAPMLTPWLECVKAMVSDTEEFAEQANVPCTVILGDARKCPGEIEPASVDFVFTSPPYPNEKDYTRTTRLESVLLGFIRDRTQLRSRKQNLLRSNTRNVYKADDDDRLILGHQDILDVSERIEQRRIELGKTSGFEKLYSRVTRLYFGGMARHLKELQTVLKPGAILAYVVGDQASFLRVMIRTGRLLAQVAESLGYEVVDIDLFRRRLATATKEYLNEEVLILRWKG